MNFANLTGLSDSYGNVTQIADATGRVLWSAVSDKVILEVEKITSDTYAGETTYTGEQFILLDIYPKTNGTVSVTYGGLTKTITDTSGAAEPNAQQVFFGTFNGVSDSVTTPASGELTIEGDYRGVGRGSYKQMGSKSASTYDYNGIQRIESFGNMTFIPNTAYAYSLSDQTVLRIPSSVKSIGTSSFQYCTSLTTVILQNGLENIDGQSFWGCTGLTSVTIPKSVKRIGYSEMTISGNTIISWLNPWRGTKNNNILSVDENNPYYKIDGNCLVEIATNRLVSGFADSNIPNYITWLGRYSFYGNSSLESITIPPTVTNIDEGAFYTCTNLNSVVIPANVSNIGIYAFTACTNLKNITLLPTVPPTLGSETSLGTVGNATITVPKGCGEAYKTAEYWSAYADYIVEAS